MSKSLKKNYQLIGPILSKKTSVKLLSASKQLPRTN